LNITKKSTEQEIIALCERRGYYLPFKRVNNFALYKVYAGAIKKMIALGIPNARQYFNFQKALLKEQEENIYFKANSYGQI
jgi:hypothetical protein